MIESIISLMLLIKATNECQSGLESLLVNSSALNPCFTVSVNGLFTDLDSPRLGPYLLFGVICDLSLQRMCLDMFQAQAKAQSKALTKETPVDCCLGCKTGNSLHFRFIVPRTFSQTFH